MIVKDYQQAIISSEKIIEIEKEFSMQSCNTLVDYSPFETVLFVAEAYF